MQYDKILVCAQKVSHGLFLDMHACICMYVCMCVCIYIYICFFALPFMYAQNSSMNMYMNICKYVRMHT